MNGSTAFHLKQIMSAEHLSVTQAAKQIGISPVSMRKVLKDAKMSTAVMFKINRFIDEHESIIATKPGELPQAAKPAESAKKTAPAKTTAKKITPAKRNHKELAEKAAAKKTAKKQPAKKVAEKPAKKATPAKTSAKAATAQPSNAKQAPAKQNASKQPATKQPAKKVSAKSTTNQPVAKNQAKKATNKANTKQTNVKTTAKTAEQSVKPVAKPTTTQAQPKKVVRKQKPARFTIHQIDGAPIQTEAEHEAERLAQAAAVEARAEQLSQAGVGSMNPTAQVPAHRKAQTPAVQQPKATASKTETKPEKTAVAEKPVTPKATPAKPVAQPQPQTKAAEPKVAPAKPAAQPEPTKPNASVKPEPNPETVKTEAPAKETPVQVDEAKAAEPKKNPQTLQLFIDESFVHGNDYQRNMFIGATLVDQDNEHALDQFSNTLYPFGWQPGDEVKARGKSHDQIAAMLTQAHGDQAQNFVTYSPQSDMGNFALGFGIWYPYLATILRVLNTLDYLPNKVRIALDRRNEFEDEQLAVAARMLNAYVKAQSGKDVMFMLRTSDSKSTIGIQYSDFSAHAALTFTKEQLAECGITRLEDLGSQIGDQITLFSMIGLQKYMLDDRSVVKQQAGFKNPVLVAAERLFRLANKATSLSQVPDETLTQAKLVVNQLLQVCPSAISGAINKMPFQTWYDMVARAAALLHYNDETLPNFELDPDAMQIAQDALNNIVNLLATAR